MFYKELAYAVVGWLSKFEMCQSTLKKRRAGVGQTAVVIHG
jgi:hypothetical protein